MRALALAMIVVLAGCGLKEEKFEEKFAVANCEWALECYDDASLEFLGWDDLDACVNDFGGRYIAETQGCVYDKKAARQCLRAMKKHPCPPAGEDPALPETCEAAFVCGDESTDDSGDSGM